MPDDDRPSMNEVIRDRRRRRLDSRSFLERPASATADDEAATDTNALIRSRRPPRRANGAEDVVDRLAGGARRRADTGR